MILAFCSPPLIGGGGNVVVSLSTGFSKIGVPIAEPSFDSVTLYFAFQ